MPIAAANPTANAAERPSARPREAGLPNAEGECLSRRAAKPLKRLQTAMDDKKG